ncbi:MAG: alkaline phosphatase [Pseudomonadota bacterium]
MITTRPLAALFTALVLSTTASAQTITKGAQVTTQDYLRQGQAEVARLKASTPINARARNVIIFIGDGMGISTLTAARIYQGQKLGRDGESFTTAMDSLSNAALVKTYSHDAQVSDSAPTASAIMGGVKARNDVIGVGPEAIVSDCPGSKDKHIPSIFDFAQSTGRATGIISTARITHATPASTYAHTPQRDWEADSDMPVAAKAEGCLDIARQMIENPVGAKLDIILGGGRSFFLPSTMADPEYTDQKGRRTDGRDLLADWSRRNPGGSFVWNARDFAALDMKSNQKVLGLFQPDHMQYEADRAKDKGGEPSLAELTRAAITKLGSKKTGYVLLVEGGRVDHGHHAGNAARALEDAVALDGAIRAALDSVNLKDTLVLVTADHSHTLTISGYPIRGNPILGIVRGVDGEVIKGRDGKAYTTLGYANGSGATTDKPRSDPAATDTTALDYKQQALVPLAGETHGGEDVAVRASGPMAHLFKGTIEQHTIYHVIREAMTKR